MKRLLLIALAAASLTACSSKSLQPDVDEANYDKIVVDGTTCVAARANKAVSIDCDWED